MQLVARVFWLPKAGNSEDDYEDAYSPRDLEKERELTVRGRALRFAVADGASEASFSRDWARLLTTAYVRGTIHLEQMEDLRHLQAQWNRRVTSAPLPWYAEEKMRMGAFSSLLGLTITGGSTEDSEEGLWQAIAIGDSCLFHIRSQDLLLSFPLGTSLDFSNHPTLVSSRPDRNSHLGAAIRSQAGKWLRGDRFLLMTDAVAAWFLKEWEAGKNPCATVLDIGTTDFRCSFPDWVRSLRTSGAMKNDDVTFLRLDIL